MKVKPERGLGRTLECTKLIEAEHRWTAPSDGMHPVRGADVDGLRATAARAAGATVLASRGHPEGKYLAGPNSGGWSATCR